MEAVVGQKDWQCVVFMAAAGFSSGGPGGAAIGGAVGLLFC